MRLARQVVGLTVALAGLQVLAGCGGVQGSSSSAPVSYNVLNGNWNIVGNGSPLSDPSISFSLVAAGSELYGQGFGSGGLW